ncbi:HK97 family phage prohead protease [Luteimicrobium sp. NPDC057192]|uniref:HK97 family phage prohead protease n=1 Tax=Luteimicrobium sp. NPDC057192 TaxID=3346042 RepID=UPI0036392230
MPETRALCVRDVAVRAASSSAGERTFTGIAVPFNDPVTISDWWGDNYREQVAPGAVTNAADDLPLTFWRHDEPIGRITEFEDTEAGWQVTGTLSSTPRGDEAYTLLRDGVIDRMSIGFEPIEHVVTEGDDGVTITRTKIRVREVSLVPFPAYDGATVDQVRHATPKGNTMPPTVTERQDAVQTPSAQSIDELRAQLDGRIDDVVRQFEVMLSRAAEAERGDKIVSRFRTPGALLKAIAAGDDEARAEYETIQARAWDPAGGTVADSVSQDAWIGDLTRIVDEKSSLRDLFSSGALPAEGMNLEYAQLKTNTVEVDKQDAEGDDLAFGKVTLETKTAPVETFGGYTRLSLQSIQRSSVAIVDHSLRALAIAANKTRNATFRAHYSTVVAAQAAANNTVTVTDVTKYVDWVSGIVDAAEKFEDLGLDLDALVVDKTYFKSLAALTATDGRPLMTVYGSGTNVVGELNAPGISGVLAGVPVRVNLKQVAAGGAFVNHLAIREYASPLARLQDDNIVNLSRDFSTYLYSAIADEIPAGIVPVKTGA